MRHLMLCKIPVVFKRKVASVARKLQTFVVIVCWTHAFNQNVVHRDSMRRQFGSRIENFVAVIAFMWLIVILQVFFNRCRVLRREIAAFTLELVVFFVRFFVLFQVLEASEAFAAHFARVRAYVAVQSLVDVEICHVTGAVLAFVARVRFDGVVDELMQAEFVGVSAGESALFAEEGLFLVGGDVFSETGAAEGGVGALAAGVQAALPLVLHAGFSQHLRRGHAGRSVDVFVPDRILSVDIVGFILKT